MLAVAFTVIATVPVGILGAWVQRTSLDKELAAVHEKHLLLAINTTAALERYAKDTVGVFDLAATLAQEGPLPSGLLDLARSLEFRGFCFVDAKGHFIRQIVAGDGEPEHFPTSALRELVGGLSDSVSFSRVLNDDNGRATIVLGRRLGEDLFVLGALDTAYIVGLQRAIAFGRQGHAAIVDHEGNLIAHPKPDWERQHKNIARIEPVRRMLAGETGVTAFYSPALKADMITGFTTTPGPGWGVMVPQPMSELEERANDVRLAVFVLALIGIATAAAISWFLAGRLTQPVHAVIDAARGISGGRLHARVALQSPFLPEELHQLSHGFNGMAERIEKDQAILMRSLEEAQTANRAKSEFLHNMSHELRTPLNAVIGFSEAMEGEMFGKIGNPKYIEYLGNIREAGIHLLAIINDILDLSKIEAGQVKIENKPVDSQGMARSALMLVEESARKEEVALKVELAADLPALRGSVSKLKQALVNLLSNAIKFTPAGGTVSFTAWRREDGGAAFEVADTGIGMSEDEIKLAFMPFRQVEGQLNRTYDGTGLGLPLAQRLIDLHGGTLRLESVPGKGTRVTVLLDAWRAPNTAAA